MDVLSPLLHLVLRSLVVLFPLTVGWLAFRRVALSKSGNAWVYAAMCLFAAVTTAGVLPWTLGITAINWFLTLLALVCPVLWIGVLVICDMSRSSRYGPDPLMSAARAIARKSAPQLAPLILKDPKFKEVTSPVFRHREPASPVAMPKRRVSPTTKAIISLARDIRGNPTSEGRRRKLLPPPEPRKLPFVPSAAET